MSSLPPGVSDYDIDRHVNGPMCNCGHWWCDHNDDKDNSCDCFTNVGLKIECPCTKFTEGEPEPEYDHDD